MVSPLGCLFGLIFGVLILLFTVAIGVVKKFKDLMSSLTSKGKDNNRQTYHGTNQSETGYEQGTNSASQTSRKIFDDDEGEYVDYEEIK